ncbi:hypothetical protein [Longimicrobium sp.]|uniref:hypothetical protein n=1 Tax=Longimicrobium sp. TaxID=2029185 RepID=UPI002C39BC04|nr:hypothetical protein [Longimicrobium sp.]HSU14243.1 hypothetical protein [Longimicrobium sp.]
MQRKLLFPTALAAVLALAACDRGITNAGTANQLSRSDAVALAGDFGDQDGAMLDGFGGPAFSASPDGPSFATSTVTTTFTRTRTCPQGGDVKLEGSLVRSWDRAAQTGSIQFTATRTEEACAFNHNGATITVTGSPNTQLTASQSVTNGTPGIRTATKKGSFTWTKSTGGSGTCTVDVTHTWDPATHTLHVSGTLCRQTIDVTRTWTQS